MVVLCKGSADGRRARGRLARPGRVATLHPCASRGAAPFATPRFAVPLFAFPLAAAAVLAPGLARAADLPVAPRNGAYVQTCPIFGAGFVKLPGTDTCVELGGSVRLDTIVQNQLTREDPTTSFFTRASVRADTRTATEYGTLRTYISFYGFSQSVPGTGLPTGDDDNTSLVQNGFQLERAFIQFYGLTAGYTVSSFDFSGGLTYFRPRVSYSKTNQLAYTFQLDPAWTATFAVEENEARQTGVDFDPFVGTRPSETPDLVGNLAYETPVLAFKLSGALHQTDSVYGDYGSELGYAVQAGLSWRFGIPLSGVALMDDPVPDRFVERVVVSAAYASGAPSYLGFDTSVFDAVLYDAQLQLTTGWNVMASWRHPWSEKWRSSFSASYATLDFAEEASLPDLDEIQVGGNLIYSPVEDLDIGGELVYIKQNQTYPDSNDDYRVVGRLRVERRF